MTMDMTRMLKGAQSGFGGGPKRTLQELAAEFGVPLMALTSLLATRNGPKPVLRHASIARRTAWYDPKAVRAWWATLPEDVRKKASL